MLHIARCCFNIFIESKDIAPQSANSINYTTIIIVQNCRVTFQEFTIRFSLIALIQNAILYPGTFIKGSGLCRVW